MESRLSAYAITGLALGKELMVAAFANGMINAYRDDSGDGNYYYVKKVAETKIEGNNKVLFNRDGASIIY